MKKLDWLHWTLLAALGLLGILLWLPPYQYEHTGTYPPGTLVRISRWTGRADRLTSSGWAPMEARTEQTAIP